MKKWILRILLLLVLLAGLFFLNLYREIGTIKSEQITDDLYMLTGAGSNVGVLRTNAGAVIVDSMTFPRQGRIIRKKVKALTGQDVSLVINTHYHLDHTHGNPAFDPAIDVYSTARTLHHLETFDAKFWDKAGRALMPNQTVTNRQTIEFGGKTIELFHPGRGHTDGDLVVFFADESTVHMGDLFFNDHFPNIDLEGGGSVIEWPASLDAVLARDFQTVIPGHGAVTDRGGILKFKEFITELAAAGQEAKANNWTRDETLANTRLTTIAGYKEMRLGGVSIGLNRDFVIGRAWDEATNSYSRRP